MKRHSILLIAAISMLLFTSCVDEYISTEALYGRWVVLSNTKENALVLEFFDDDVVDVHNSSWSYRPFTSDCSWDYYLDRDSVLHLSRYVSDADGESREYINLNLSFSDSYRTLTLVHDPLVGSVRRFTFMKRN